jgi:hypothetical protein
MGVKSGSSITINKKDFVSADAALRLVAEILDSKREDIAGCINNIEESGYIEGDRAAAIVDVLTGVRALMKKYADGAANLRDGMKKQHSRLVEEIDTKRADSNIQSEDARVRDLKAKKLKG